MSDHISTTRTRGAHERAEPGSLTYSALLAARDHVREHLRDAPPPIELVMVHPDMLDQIMVQADEHGALIVPMDWDHYTRYPYEIDDDCMMIIGDNPALIIAWVYVDEKVPADGLYIMNKPVPPVFAIRRELDWLPYWRGPQWPTK
jgi:hypothetical protein